MKKKILIVEDEILIGMMLAETIKDFGYYAIEQVATTGEEAIAAVRDESPDAILMDISLSGPMDGIQAAEIIHQKFPVPILFFTGYRDAKLLKRAEATNPVAILDKLGPAEELKEVLDNLFT